MWYTALRSARKFSFVFIILSILAVAGCSLLDSDDSGTIDPGPIADPYDIEIKQMDRKDYLVCCGDTLRSRSEFFFDERSRLTRYEFFTDDGVNTLFNTYTYIDANEQVDIFKRFVNQTNSGVPALTDSVGFTYNDIGQLTELTQYSSPDGSTISSFSIQFNYDENGRLKRILRGSRTVDLFYDERGNMIRSESNLFNQQTGEFELNTVRRYRYGDVKNPFFRKQLIGVVFVLGLDRNLSPYAPVEFTNGIDEDEPVSGGTLDYEVNEDGFPAKSRLIFQNFDGVSEGTVVETEFTYLE
ncbi:MAG: hypothetical protein GVY20_01170 [Bacteroidetes bacterium]|jgi:hypothetical protein|nr:hypothetical protein [Bacteroidota bacterium]